MEAASAHHSAPLTRDGDVPATPAVGAGPVDLAAEPIDGVVRCCCCKRFPLLGEHVVHHRRGGRAGWVCAGCEAEGRGGRLGPVVRTARIRSLGGAMNVRRIA